MRLAHKILANGNPFDFPIQKIVVQDNIGYAADNLTMMIPFPYSMEFPNTGAILSVYLGLDLPEYIGTFSVDFLNFSDPPQILTIRGKGIATNLAPESFSTNRDRAFQKGTPLGKILEIVAAEHTLSLSASDEIRNIIMPYTHQMSESDSSFLFKITNQRDLALKFNDGIMAVIKRDSAKSATGEEIQKVEIHQSEVTDFSFGTNDLRVFNTVSAKYQDYYTGGIASVSVGNGEDPSHILKTTFSDYSSAEMVAETVYNESRRGGKKISFSMPYTYRGGVIAGAELSLRDFALSIDDSYIISSVTHRYGKSYTLGVEAKLKSQV